MAVPISSKFATLTALLAVTTPALAQTAEDLNRVELNGGSQPYAAAMYAQPSDGAQPYPAQYYSGTLPYFTPYSYYYPYYYPSYPYPYYYWGYGLPVAFNLGFGFFPGHGFFFPGHGFFQRGFVHGGFRGFRSLPGQH
jgi:hypothetical protein